MGDTRGGSIPTQTYYYKVCATIPLANAPE